MADNVVTEDALKAALSGLSGWTSEADGKTIGKQFKFKDFSQAFGFMARVALLAEAANHHPDWSNGYNVVRIGLSTHSAGGVTQKDIDLAGKIEALLT